MTRSQLFSKAHAMTRRAIRPGDDYRASFAAALRHLHALERAERLAAAVTEMGDLPCNGFHNYIVGRVWARHGKVRVYVNTTHRRPASYGYFDVLAGRFVADCDADDAATLRALAA